MLVTLFVISTPSSAPARPWFVSWVVVCLVCEQTAQAAAPAPASESTSSRRGRHDVKQEHLAVQVREKSIRIGSRRAGGDGEGEGRGVKRCDVLCAVMKTFILFPPGGFCCHRLTGCLAYPRLPWCSLLRGRLVHGLTPDTARLPSRRPAPLAIDRAALHELIPCSSAG